MARSRRRPLILGPDAEGTSVVVAGDRICWVGAGSPPPTPGARRVPCPGGRVAAARWGVSSRCEVEPDATGMVLSGVPGAEASHRAAVVRAAGVRVVVVVDDADRDRPSFEAAFRGERDPLVRYAVTGVSATADVDEDTGVPIIAPDQAPGDVGARAFGRRFDPEPGAAGDVRVVDARTGAVLHVVVAGELREPSAGG